ncbi:MAG: noncanonical pyrimidine nucleotidase, YjjG family [Bacteroidia bacterium]|nr:noncanonical pyrimidine nucleotidase, YjjG family [Bacteroidia bacterium]
MPGLKQKRHLFFDLDDTLWDFQRNSNYVLRQLYSEFDLQAKLKTDFDGFLSAYKRINQQLWQQYNQRLVDKNHIRNHRFNLAFKEFGYDNYSENLSITEQYLERAPKGTHLKEDCLAVLDYLKPKYELHIITNGFKEIQAIKLDGAGLRNYFGQIIISEEHQMVKPEEQLFRLAERLAGAHTNECVMIGDNFESDIKGALNAGWEAIHFVEDNEPAYTGRQIKKLKELKALF